MTALLAALAALLGLFSPSTSRPDPVSTGVPVRPVLTQHSPAQRDEPQRASRGASRTGVVNAGWAALVACEASGDWQANTGNGFYGGPQFTLATYHAYGGVGYPQDYPPAVQIAVGCRVLASQGQGAWPVCGPRAGLDANDCPP